jgi:hypothetical protein
VLQPQVEQVLVCNPRRNALLKEGSKDRHAGRQPRQVAAHPVVEKCGRQNLGQV